MKKLELILNKVRGMAWTRFIWLGIPNIGGLPEIGKLNSQVPSNAGNSLSSWGRLRLKCDGTRTETRFRLPAKRKSPFKSAGASVHSTTGSRVVRISGSNAGYTVFRGSVKGTGYPLHSPVSPSLPLPCVTVCHHVSAGLYYLASQEMLCIMITSQPP